MHVVKNLAKNHAFAKNACKFFLSYSIPRDHEKSTINPNKSSIFISIKISNKNMIKTKNYFSRNEVEVRRGPRGETGRLEANDPQLHGKVHSIILS